MKPLTLSAEGSLAKTSVSPEKVPDLLANDPASGTNTAVSSKKSARVTSSLKTLQPFALEDWIKFSGASLRSGTMLNGIVYPLAPLAPLTGVIGSGLLPTPSGTTSGKNHVVGRLDEWGGSSNPFRGTEIGRVRCASFEEWMMGFPTGWTDSIRFATRSSRKSPK